MVRVWRAITAVMLLAASAGCFDDGPGRNPTPEELGETQAWTKTYLPGYNLTGEPSIAVAPDGTTYVLAVAADVPDLGTANLVWRGDGNATRWTSLGPVNADRGSEDGDIAVRADGSVWAATLWLECTTVAVSRDQGSTWSDGQDACGAGPVGQRTWYDRPWLATTADATYLSYLLTPPLVATTPVGSAIARSADGESWASALSGLPPGFVPGRLASDGVRLALAMAPAAASPDPSAPGASLGHLGVTMAVSADGGASWTYHPVTQATVDGRLNAALAPDAAVIAWTEASAAGHSLRVASAAADLLFRSETVASEGTNVYAWASITNDHVLVTWLHTASAAGPGHVAADAQWRVRMLLDGVVREFPPVVATGPLCPTGTIVNVAGCRILGDFFSSALLPDGTPVVALNDGTAAGAEAFRAPTIVLRGVPPQV